MPITTDNCYFDLTFADQFHADRGNEDWTFATLPEKTAAAINATDFLDAHFRALSPRSDPAQPLQWPTQGQETIPSVVRAATCLLALYALSGPLSRPYERGVKSVTESLDGTGSVSTVYDDATKADPYPMATAMLDGVASSRSSGFSAARIIR